MKYNMRVPRAHSFTLEATKYKTKDTRVQSSQSPPSQSLTLAWYCCRGHDQTHLGAQPRDGECGDLALPLLFLP